MKIENSIFEFSFNDLVSVARSIENYNKYGVLPCFANEEVTAAVTEALIKTNKFSSEKKSKTNTPSLRDIEEFCFANKLSVSPYAFWKYWEDRFWISDGKPIHNWRGMLISWEKKRSERPSVDPLIRELIERMSMKG